MDCRYIEIVTNPGKVKLTEVPVLDYAVFTSVVDDLLAEQSNHCLTYHVIPFPDYYKFICCVGCDETHTIKVFCHHQLRITGVEIDSLTARHFSLHVFEREIHEQYSIDFPGHPWLKPVRFPHNRTNMANDMDHYPFYEMESEELHEVGVGPIHAGIIEPGHFRFICNGEKVLHLEIQLGYQHRGIEQLFVTKKQLLQKAILAENISGDTTVGHTLCHAGLIEVMGKIEPAGQLILERNIALELERIAIHIGDTAALCTDIGYQFGQVVNEALRTIVINTMQSWCGNRFGKGLIRPGGSHYSLDSDTTKIISANLKEVLERSLMITSRIFAMPSVLSRFEGTGKLNLKQAALIGAVGMAARSSGLHRDIRWSHPITGPDLLDNFPVILHKGDVWSRAMMRKIEVENSVAKIYHMIGQLNGSEKKDPSPDIPLQPSSLAISLVEGWRGEICHTAVTDENGQIVNYKIKDPSFHNWMALALAVRDQEISDFPLCNKSFNLSYCGNDL
jgi:Ni,Fe-hydrogenase III large subunit